jgi:hypothetical protein
VLTHTVEKSSSVNVTPNLISHSLITPAAVETTDDAIYQRISAQIPKITTQQSQPANNQAFTVTETSPSIIPQPQITQASSLKHIPISIESSSLPNHSLNKGTLHPAINSIIPASATLMKLSAKELSRITQDNTVRNAGYKSCILEVEVVRMEGPRPPSPSEKLRNSQDRAADSQNIMKFPESEPNDALTKVQWQQSLCETYFFAQDSIIMSSKQKGTSPIGRCSGPLKSCLRRDGRSGKALLPLDRVKVKVLRVDFQEDLPPEPVPPVTRTPPPAGTKSRSATPAKTTPKNKANIASGPGRIAVKNSQPKKRPLRVKAQ